MQLTQKSLLKLTQQNKRFQSTYLWEPCLCSDLQLVSSSGAFHTSPCS